jgi:hypothetical protein
MTRYRASKKKESSRHKSSSKKKIETKNRKCNHKARPLANDPLPEQGSPPAPTCLNRPSAVAESDGASVSAQDGGTGESQTNQEMDQDGDGCSDVQGEGSRAETEALYPSRTLLSSLGRSSRKNRRLNSAHQKVHQHNSGSRKWGD